jgi:hypothetical protein
MRLAGVLGDGPMCSRLHRSSNGGTIIATGKAAGTRLVVYPPGK